MDERYRAFIRSILGAHAGSPESFERFCEAQLVWDTAMAINAVRTEVFGAQVEGFTVAGKTGTAQIPEGGIYHPTDTIGSFIGWFPADSPEVVVLVKLDRPKVSPWGSMTAAPAELATDLAALMDIPPDSIRLNGDVMVARGN